MTAKQINFNGIFASMPFYFLTILEQLEKLDQWLFIKINSGLANPFLDSFMPFMRYPLNWAPLYLFLAVFALLKDRKSTRLNSSHVKISYAVFCLKKKKSN